MSRLISILVLALVACVQEPTPVVVAPAPAQKPIRVDVWHDTVCPWCRIGLHNLGVALEGWKGAPVEIVHHPFLLEPDMPAAGQPLRERLGAKFGPGQVEQMFARVTQAGAASGVRFDWAAVKISPQTAPSHALIEWCPEAKRAALVDAIHRAYFEEGRNIGDWEELAGIAVSVGLDGAEAGRVAQDPARLASVKQRANEASQTINGVPHFVIGDRVLEGAQSAGTLRDALAAASGR